MYKKRSDPCLNSKFKTANGDFVVVGVNFKDGERIGLTIIAATNWKQYAAGKTRGVFKSDVDLLKAEQEDRLVYLGDFNPSRY